MIDGNVLLLENLPAYCSLIIEKDSGGLGGEIYINESEIGFFDLTGNIVEVFGKTDKNKQGYELAGRNIFRFDFDNVVNYLTQVKSEYVRPWLNNYKLFERHSDMWKNVGRAGWNYRLQKVVANKNDLSFPFYIKRSTNGRCYAGSNDISNIYSMLIAYTVIPKYTSLAIEKRELYGNSTEYIFRLFFNEDFARHDTQVVKRRNENSVRTNKTTQELLEEALNREHARNEQQSIEADNEKRGRASRIIQSYERDDVIAAAVKSRAEGKCDLCRENAPFFDQYGRPYLEEHHVEWLANGGEDSINNAVALCPNCHRKMHVLNNECDVEALKNRLAEYQRLFIAMPGNES